MYFIKIKKIRTEKYLTVCKEALFIPGRADNITVVILEINFL